MSTPDTYAQRGVDSSKAGLHALIDNEHKGLFPGAFCKIVPDVLSADPERCLAMHADGVGTKLALAYAVWKQADDLSVWKDVVQDGLQMNIGDILCAGDFGNILVSSTIGMNSLLVSDDVVGALFQGFRSYAEMVEPWGINLYNTGGETASVGDLVRTIDLNYTCAGSIRRSSVVSADRIRPGDVIVGLASSGKALYEERFNSGIGSNGLTSARHDIFNSSVGNHFPETVSPQMRSDLVYRGKYWLMQRSPVEGLTYAELLLSPTRTYIPIMKQVFRQVKHEHLHGIIHNTGGGQTKVKRFLQSVRAIKDNLLPTPQVFRIIQEESQTSWREMYKTYNMGHLLEYYVPEEQAQTIIDIALGYNVEAKIIGCCEAKDAGDGVKAEVVVRSEHGEFIYS